MEHFSKSLPTQNDLRQRAMQQSTKSSQNIPPDIIRQRASQFQALLSQSYEIFNVFGKQPEAVKTAVQAFMMVLENRDMGDIQGAFKTWMQTSSTFPTPADILKIVKENEAHRRHMALQEENIAIVREAIGNAPPKIKSPTVPWFGLQWSQFTDQHRQQLERHLDELGDKAPGYIQYLNQFVGAPHPTSPTWSPWRKSAP